MKYYNKLIFAFLILFALLLPLPQSNAQCAMCKATVESNLKDKTNQKGKGLNTGILYLMSMPYIIGGSALAYWYYHRKKKNLVRE